MLLKTYFPLIVSRNRREIGVSGVSPLFTAIKCRHITR